MKRNLCLMPIVLMSNLASAQNEIDLTQPANYANQPVPAYITRDNTPADNPITDMGATLGRVLFYDKRLSRNDTVSCASCHNQANAFSDVDTASTGVSGQTGRHSMRLINPRFSGESRFFWDERAATAEAQATTPIKDHAEMGFSGTNGDPDFNDLVTKLSAIEVYQVLFQAVYDDPTITEERVGKAIAQFVRSIQSFDSKYDVGRAQVPNDGAPFPNFTAQENQGKDVFLRPPNLGGAGCAGCHQPPEFSIDPATLNNGVIGVIAGGTDLTNTRSPSLRDVVGPDGLPHTSFMHNASFPTLRAVIDHYNVIPALNPNIDPRLIMPGGQPQRLNLSTVQKDAMEAFLKTLTGSNVYTDAKWSDPFDSEGNLTPVLLPVSGAGCEREEVDGTMHTRVSVAAVPNVTYGFQSSADLETWATTPVKAAADGTIDLLVPDVPGETRRFFRFRYPAP